MFYYWKCRRRNHDAIKGIEYRGGLCTLTSALSNMTGQEQILLKQFEKDLEKAIGIYLNKRNNILKDGNGRIYIVKNTVQDSLFVPKMDPNKLNMLVEFLKTPSNTQPKIEGSISLSIKGDEDEDYNVRVYFFEICTSHYHINTIEDIDIDQPNHYDIALTHVDYFEEQKYRLY